MAKFSKFLNISVAFAGFWMLTAYSKQPDTAGSTALTKGPAGKLQAIPIHQLIRASNTRSVQGQPIVVHKNLRPSQFRVLINGQIHGNEQHSGQFVRWLIHRYQLGQSHLNSLPAGVAIDFLPVSNPDGAAKNKRYNQREVNLNRNFSVFWGITKENPGKSPMSEPETKSLSKLFDKRQYSMAIDVHGYAPWIVMPSAAGKKAGMKMSFLYDKWQTSVSQLANKLPPKYSFPTALGLGDGGSFEDWAFWKREALSFCLELSTDILKYSSSAHPQSLHPKLQQHYVQYEKFLQHSISSGFALTSTASPNNRAELNSGKTTPLRN